MLPGTSAAQRHLSASGRHHRLRHRLPDTWVLPCTAVISALSADPQPRAACSLQQTHDGKGTVLPSACWENAPHPGPGPRPDGGVRSFGIRPKGLLALTHRGGGSVGPGGLVVLVAQAALTC